MDGAWEVMARGDPLPGCDVAMDLSVRDPKTPWKRKEESDEEDRKPSSSTHETSNGSPEEGSAKSDADPHKPQDLRLRRTLREGRLGKRERLEEMVNHIRRVSAEQQRPVTSNPWGRGADREDSDTSDEEGPWRPEDIFFLRSPPPTPEDAHSPQDLRVKRVRAHSPPRVPPAHPPSAPAAALVQRFLQMALPWPSCDSQASYLPWMAYNYYAHMTRQHIVDRRGGEEEEGAETTSSPTPPPASQPAAARKRAPRALTGKHVKQGTGASPSTLRTLRQTIEERQRTRPPSHSPVTTRGKGSRRKAASSTVTSATVAST